ncbi:hypothetical protein PG985_005582 [Apiospora marii]|uniref:uncharacterized protein n=1 Tax=Apiospora marii TaxID=335849 RepID=UPI0031327053
MDSMRYVRLLPSDFTTSAAPGPDTALVAPPPLVRAVINETRKRKRVGTQLACNLCRLKKTRCDGTRPSCHSCVRRSKKCVYNDKRDAAQGAVDIVELLYLAPYAEALDILRLLRTAGDASVVLSVIRGNDNDSPDSPSEHSSPRTFVPQRSSRSLRNTGHELCIRETFEPWTDHQAPVPLREYRPRCRKMPPAREARETRQALAE